MRYAVIAMVIMGGYALFADISYPVDVEATRWAVLDKDAGKVIKRNKKWPVRTGERIKDLAPNLVLLRQVEQEKPEYDERTHRLIPSEAIDQAANTITKSYVVEKRTKPEIKQAVKDREKAELAAQGVDLVREAVETRLMIYIILRKQNGATLTQAEKDFAAAYHTKGVKVWQNRERCQELLQKVNQGEDIDLDAGWATP